MSKEINGNFICFYDESDVDDVVDDVLTGDEEEIAEMEAITEAKRKEFIKGFRMGINFSKNYDPTVNYSELRASKIRQAKLKQIYLDLGVK